MKTVGEIQRLRREELGLTLTAIAEEVGVTKSYLSMIENHRVNMPPSKKIVAALERALQIGDGELMRAAQWQKTPPEIRQRLEQLSEKARRGEEFVRWFRDATSPRAEGGRNLDKLFRSGELNRRVNAALATAKTPSSAKMPGSANVDRELPVRFQVPIINKVAAGYPKGFTDLDYPARVADEFVPCPDVHDSQAFAARIVGESMLPEYREGDVVIFSPVAKIASGNDCLVRLLPDHEVTFKRVFFDGAGGKESGKIRLQPLNPSFAPTLLDRRQIAGMYKAVCRYQKLG